MYRYNRGRHVEWKGTKVPSHFTKKYDEWHARQIAKNPNFTDDRTDAEIVNHMQTAYKSRNRSRVEQQQAAGRDQLSAGRRHLDDDVGAGPSGVQGDPDDLTDQRAAERRERAGKAPNAVPPPARVTKPYTRSTVHRWETSQNDNVNYDDDDDDMFDGIMDGDDDGFEEDGMGINQNGLGGIAGANRGSTYGKGWNRVGYVNPEPSMPGKKHIRYSRKVEHMAYSLNQSGAMTENDIAYEPSRTHDHDKYANRLYTVPYYLMRAAMTPTDLRDIYDRAAFARISGIGFTIVSANIKETVIEGSNNNPKLRDKAPNDVQIQYKWDFDGSIHDAESPISALDVPASAALAEKHASGNHEFMQDQITDTTRGAYSKELPKTSGLVTSYLSQDSWKEYFNDVITPIYGDATEQQTGKGNEILRLSDILKTTSIKNIVGNTYHVPYGKQTSWLGLHNSVRGTKVWNKLDINSPSPRHSYNELKEIWNREHQTNVNSKFPNSLAYNVAWYETLTNFEQSTTGHVEGLLDSFPTFVFRIRDEDDLQGPISRYLEMVFEYHVDIEYIPIVMPNNHIMLSRYGAGILPALFKTPQMASNSDAYNFDCERKRVWNRRPTMGFKNVNTIYKKPTHADNPITKNMATNLNDHGWSINYDRVYEKRVNKNDDRGWDTRLHESFISYVQATHEITATDTQPDVEEENTTQKK